MKITSRMWKVLLSGVLTMGSSVLWTQASVQPASAHGSRSGQELYLSACSGCHGADGRGVAKGRVAFEEELPDFTDCSFASREPDSDWIGVAHDGGPARGFSEMMPAFGDALSQEELGLIMAYIRTMCTSDAWPRGELNLPRPLVTEKAYPEDEAVITSAISAEGPGSVMNKLVYEKRFGARNQYEVILPFGWQESDRWNGGIGDIAVSVKRAFFHSSKTGSIFSGTFEVKLPTGNEDKGFGKGTTVFEPFVSFGQLLPADSFLHFQGGFELPADTSKGHNEAFWRFVLGRTFTQGNWGRAWSPMIEFLGGKDLECGEKVKWDVVPQMQVTLNTRQHIMLNVGLRIPVTESSSRHTEVLIYLLWDWFDGGFFEGW